MLQEPFKYMIVVNTYNAFCKIFLKYFRNSFEILAKIFQNLFLCTVLEILILVKSKEQRELPNCK